MPADWPDLPVGFVRLAHVDDLLQEREQAWQILPESSHSSSFQWRSLSGRLGRLGNGLVYGSPRAVGLLRDGQLVWIGTGQWSLFNADGSSLLHDVISGKNITLEDQCGVTADALPLVAAHALAKTMDARRPPDAPRAEIMSRVLDLEAGDWLAPRAEPAPPPPLPSPEPPSAPVVRNRGGRKPMHDWDGFWIEALHFGWSNGFEGVNLEKLITHMHKWAAKMENGRREAPDPSAVRDKLAKLREAAKKMGA